MTDEQTIKAVNALLLLSIALITQAVFTIPYALDDHKTKKKDIAGKIETYYNPEITEEVRRPNEAILGEAKLRNKWNDIQVIYTTIEFDYLGRYFITAYCPEECGGSWMTSSGATCHYTDEWSEPTTCAIDRNYHGFGEFLMVGDPEDADRKIYVTEDTGPGVRGLWIDCFVVTMQEVKAWPTGWKPVYQVTYVTNTLDKNERMENHERLNNYIHYCRADYRLRAGNGSGIISGG